LDAGFGQKTVIIFYTGTCNSIGDKKNFNTDF